MLILLYLAFLAEKFDDGGLVPGGALVTRTSTCFRRAASPRPLPCVPRRIGRQVTPLACMVATTAAGRMPVCIRSRASGRGGRRHRCGQRRSLAHQLLSPRPDFLPISQAPIDTGPSPAVSIKTWPYLASAAWNTWLCAAVIVFIGMIFWGRPLPLMLATVRNMKWILLDVGTAFAVAKR
jgi:hypothetical protein